MNEDLILLALAGAFLCFVMAHLAATFTSAAVLILYLFVFFLLCWALKLWWQICKSTSSSSSTRSTSNG